MLRFDPHVFLLSAGKPAKKNGIIVLARSPFWKYVSEWLFAGERLPGRILPGGDMGSQMYVFRGRPNPGQQTRRPPLGIPCTSPWVYPPHLWVSSLPPGCTPLGVPPPGCTHQKIQKDVQGSISPLRVYISRVSVYFLQIRIVFQVSVSDQKNQKDAQGSIPPLRVCMSRVSV